MKDMFFSVNYSFLSSLDDNEENRYIQHITGNIYATDFESRTPDSPDMPVGTIEGYKLLLNYRSIPLYIVIDNAKDIMDVAGVVYDVEFEDWTDEIYTQFNLAVHGSNLLILSRMQILPAFRGKGIGKKAIKDYFNSFINGCGLFGLKCFPLQWEAGILEKDDQYTRDMQYDKFDSDYDRAFRRLKSYYKKMGFVPVVDDETVLVINPALKNKKFDAIKFD